VKVRFPRWIGVVCEDFDRQRAFYQDALGFREMAAGADWVQFDLGPGVTFELLRRSQDPEYDQPRYQVGFVVDDIQSAQAELVAKGAEAVTDVIVGSDGESRWAYFRDPDGNVFEITQRA
jgi:catechol 2,3-dioxygenase-like lactoylglutathione lyase family enzyme